MEWPLAEILKRNPAGIPVQSPAGTVEGNLEQVTDETSREIAKRIPESLGIFVPAVFGVQSQNAFKESLKEL